MSIYLSPIGDKLTDPLFFTPAIRTYLDAESELILRLSEGYDIIIEACCTKGRYASLARSLHKRYIGIDKAAHHIADAERMFAGDTATFICDDIGRLEEMMEHLLPAQGSLVVFPFNAFGNLEDAEDMLRSLAARGLPFLICTYTTDTRSEEVRAEYYSKAGFDELVLSGEKSGVRFTDSCGLDSMAYNEAWFEDMFRKYGIPCKCIPFGEIGVAYLNF
jgi:Cys-tRNA synthase (O-phospho-L-seryl-tRNA:Cys-tRNA synthase)